MTFQYINYINRKFFKFDPKFKKMSDVYNEIESVKIAGKTIYVNNYLNRNLNDEDEDEENI